MIGKTISHYKILEKLGEGGMGVVYKAEDTHLQRLVALKFLPPHITSSPEEKARFLHEARLASALNHSNVTTIHAIEEGPEGTFIVMEYIEGKTLKQIKETLSIKKILEIGIQICEGLDAAHRKEIVHRDIKSDNIMLTKEGQVKIMDFGLAKLKGATKLTKAGSTLGTVEYMSPEQSSGEEVDQRSDIFSFGVVLYEMLTSKLPFGGEHQAAIIYSILNDEPQPVARYNNQVSAKMEDIVSKALAKDRSERYQHIDDLLADLRREKKSLEYAKSTSESMVVPTKKTISKTKVILVGVGVVVLVAAVFIITRFLGLKSEKPDSQRKMIAVLPFENLGSAEQEYFADGITEEITARLANIQQLGVIARTSVMPYKKTSKSVQQIGSELGVEYVLEGTIRWQKSSQGESKVRVTPQLIRVKDATHLWAEVYDQNMSEVFKVQSDIAQKVVSAMDVALAEQERQALEAKPTDNLEAYEYYLRGNDYFYLYMVGKKEFQIASEMYQKAVELDPNFAQAYAKLSMAQIELYWHHDRIEELLRQAKKAVDKAFQLKPGLAEAHLALGSYYYHALDYERALEQFSIAQKSLPNNTQLLMEIGFLKRRQGKWEEALASFIKAMELDPANQTIAFQAGLSCYFMRNYSQAKNYLDRVISLAPDWNEPYILKSWVYILREGNTTKARQVLQEAETKVRSVELAVSWVLLDIFDGQYKMALKRLTGPDIFAFDPLGFEVNDTAIYFLTKAKVYKLTKQTQLEHAYYDSACIILEKEIKGSPNEFSYSLLGLAYAGLGRKEEAISQGRKAVEMRPISKDAFYGVDLTQLLAEIYVMVGEYDSALEQLEHLLSLPSQLSVSLLRIDPTWAPLRNHPRFQKLLAKDKKV